MEPPMSTDLVNIPQPKKRLTGRRFLRNQPPRRQATTATQKQRADTDSDPAAGPEQAGAWKEKEAAA
eukprot:CAMPEP_0174380910 /NCGR_PEP_ID=MMETSP0811_2-20130205/123670_1 /TAXON_ID=73025 ORGANISM="Eutreptiella gymnastica-like, Strain CCMP1594" /NCGR_SAMPLE_ID=MMETSP0811_2 /ASSEMBLY_ACC=CAM_ASM_000667 /LENGTH=66 /DNA_ID=CAMNT_0015533897 /DNA_START=2012 /DNA_END=2213 /DNA_ORIENTATION=-